MQMNEWMPLVRVRNFVYFILCVISIRSHEFSWTISSLYSFSQSPDGWHVTLHTAYLHTHIFQLIATIQTVRIVQSTFELNICLVLLDSAMLEEFLTLDRPSLPKPLRFAHIWLRDHCRCSECYSPMHQRQFNILDIPLDVRPQSHSSTEDVLSVICELIVPLVL